MDVNLKNIVDEFENTYIYVYYIIVVIIFMYVKYQKIVLNI